MENPSFYENPMKIQVFMEIQVFTKIQIQVFMKFPQNPKIHKFHIFKYIAIVNGKTRL
jgi:hypothetical protein